MISVDIVVNGCWLLNFFLGILGLLCPDFGFQNICLPFILMLIKKVFVACAYKYFHLKEKFIQSVWKKKTKIFFYYIIIRGLFKKPEYTKIFLTSWLISQIKSVGGR